MKKFLFNFFKFLLLLLIISLIIDLLISNSLNNKKGFGLGEVSVWSDIYHNEINANLLIYGSSRAWVHFNPNIIEDSLNISTYNLGIDGHNFRIQYLRHLEFMKNNHKPRYIIHSLDCFTFQKRKDLYNYEQFLPFMLFNFNMFNYTYSYEGFNFFGYFLPLIRYSGLSNIFEYLFNSNDISQNYDRNKGFRGQDKNWNNDLEKAKSKLNSYNIRIEKSEILLYESFLNDCKQKGIEVILVYSPEHIDGQKFVENRHVVFTLFKYLAIKYNLHFIDYSNDEMCYKYEYFYNSSHLNKTGANLFTSKLCSDLKKIINN